MDIKKFVGEKIKLRRQELGIKQDAFGDACGLSRASITNMEKGKHSPTVERLYIICCVLKIPMQEVLPPIVKLKKDFVVVEKIVRVKKKKVIWK